MTSQKTIERCRSRVKELEETNVVLLKNNETLAAANKELRKQNEKLDKLVQSQFDIINDLDLKQRSCKQKCEVALSEKDRLLQEKERRLANVKPTIEHLKAAKWFYRLNQLPDGQIEIIHTVKFA